jgi:hypothetical protein
MEKPFTPETLSEFLEVPVRTLEDWRGRDYGPAWFRAGNRIRYTPSAVRDWMEGQSSTVGHA